MGDRLSDGINDHSDYLTTDPVGATGLNPDRELRCLCHSHHYPSLSSCACISVATILAIRSRDYFRPCASLALSISFSALSSAWPSLALASPARRSALPSDSRSLLPVRVPATSLAWPFT